MNKIRRYDLDWLRTIGVLLVIPFHSLLIFDLNPWAIVYIKDKINVWFFNIISTVIDRFHMPLLFVLAGMAVFYAMQIRKPKEVMKERFSKLLIPAILGSIFLNPVMTYFHIISSGNNITFFEHLINFFSKNPEDLTGLNGAFTPAHLWFLIFLFAYSVIGLPIFIWFNQESKKQFRTRLENFFEKRFMLALTVIPITIISAIDILGDRNPFVYFLMFCIGYLLATGEQYQTALNRDWWFYSIISIILFVIWYYFPNCFEPWSLAWIGYAFFDKAVRFLPVLALIGIGNKYLNHNSFLLEYLSKASFSVYIIHMLINTLVGFIIVQLQIGVVVKFILIVIITYLLCFLFYEIMRRFKLFRLVLALKPIDNNRVQK